MITGPLAKLDATIKRSVQILIVIDAHDECNDRDGISRFLSLLNHETLRNLKQIRVVFLLTSRPVHEWQANLQRLSNGLCHYEELK